MITSSRQLIFWRAKETAHFILELQVTYKSAFGHTNFRSGFPDQAHGERCESGAVGMLTEEEKYERRIPEIWSFPKLKN